MSADRSISHNTDEPILRQVSSFLKSSVARCAPSASGKERDTDFQPARCATGRMPAQRWCPFARKSCHARLSACHVAQAVACFLKGRNRTRIVTPATGPAFALPSFPGRLPVARSLPPRPLAAKRWRSQPLDAMALDESRSPPSSTIPDNIWEGRFRAFPFSTMSIY